MKISIVIPVYNKEEYLVRCFESIFKQIDINDDKYEVLVVDDGSVDNSMSIIEEYAARHSLLTVIKQENSGVSVARNTAINIAVGQFILFLDADDELIENSLPKVHNFLSQNSNVDMLVTIQTRHNGVTEKVVGIRGLIEGKIFTGVEAYQKGYVRMNAGGGICRTEFLRKHKISFPNGVRNSEDTIFWGVVQSYAQSIAFFDIPLYRIHEIAGSASRSDYTQIALYHIDTIKAVIETRNGLDCTPAQRGIFEFYVFQLLSNTIARFAHSKDLCYRQFYEKICLSEILPIETRYMRIRRRKAQFLNFSHRLYYFVSWLKHR